MVEAREIITQLEKAVHRLTVAHRESLRELKELREENEKLSEKVRSMTIEKRDMQTEMERLQGSDVFAGGPRTKAARRQINRLLREVDDCIALLTSKE